MGKTELVGVYEWCECVLCGGRGLKPKNSKESFLCTSCAAEYPELIKPEDMGNVTSPCDNCKNVYDNCWRFCKIFKEFLLTDT